MDVKAYAKINLSLDVLRRRDDGYHDLRMVMQEVSLTDDVAVTLGGGALKVRTNLAFLPNDERNLAAIAARHFQEETGIDLGGVSIDLNKRIPVCAGMAGGSSNAAAVLRALNALTGANLPVDKLCALGEKVGADVPYCVLGGTALAEGKGEILTPLSPLPHCHIVLCKPAWSVSTPQLFGVIDGQRIRHRPDTDGLISALHAGNLTGVAQRMYNVFEDALPPRRRDEVTQIKNTLIHHGALGATMTGTGSTVFGIFGDISTAKAAYKSLKTTYRDTFLTESCCAK